jgi:hypothetical protein
MTAERNYDQKYSKMSKCIEEGCYLVHTMRKQLSSVSCSGTSLLITSRSEGPATANNLIIQKKQSGYNSVLKVLSSGI